MMRRRVGVGLHLLFASMLTFLALLVLVPAQTTTLWKLEILAREQGHWFAAIALLAGIVLAAIPDARSSGTQRIATALTLVAGIVLATPVMRAIAIGRTLPAQLATFGDTTPRTGTQAPARTSPVQLSTLFTGIPLENQPRTLQYAAANGDSLGIDFIGFGKEPAPLVVVIHGGSWRGGSRADLAELGRYLSARGYAVAAISYRFAPEHRYPAAREDVRRAILFLKSRAAVLGVDSSRIVLLGRSAGGHLALLSAYADRDPSIRGVVGLYPVTDLRWGYEHPTNPRVLNSTKTLEEFLGGSPAVTGTRYEEASPLSYVDSATPPTLLIHGNGDELVFPEHVRRLRARLTAMKRPNLLLAPGWATHGCDYFIQGPCGQLVTYTVERFVAAVTR